VRCRSKDVESMVVGLVVLDPTSGNALHPHSLLASSLLFSLFSFLHSQMHLRMGDSLSSSRTHSHSALLATGRPPHLHGAVVDEVRLRVHGGPRSPLKHQAANSYDTGRRERGAAYGKGVASGATGPHLPHT
jgi:hypothetical protein